MRGRCLVRASVPLVMLLAGGATAGALGSVPQARAGTLPTITLPTNPRTTTTTSPATPPPAPGPQTVDYGYDAAHDFAASDPAITLPLGARWSVATQGDPVALLAADSVDFVLIDQPSSASPTSATLEALDPDTGATRWSQAVPIDAALAYESGVLATAGNNEIQAFASTTGAPLWTLALNGVGAITPADGELYADAAGGGATADTIDAVNAATGKVDWSTKPPNPGGAGPLGVAGDRVYRTETTQWQAFDRITGKLIWHQQTSATAGAAETATLWEAQLFRVGFTPGLSLPGTMLDGGPVSADSGASETAGAPAEIVSGNVGLQTRGTGVVAADLNSDSVLWSSLAQPLAILNGYALTYDAYGIQLRDLSSGKALWSAQLDPTSNATPVTAVGNQELLIGAGGHVTALVPGAYASRSTKLKIATQYLVYRGSPITGSATITEPGIQLAQPLAIAGEPWPFKAYGPPTPVSTNASGKLTFTEQPALDTIYRISLPGSTQALGVFEIVVLPKVAYRFLRPSYSHRKLHGNVKVTVDVPPSVRLAHDRASLYIGVAKRRRYLWLGSGALTGGKGHFTGQFPYNLEHKVGRKDFVVACFAGIYRQGMSFGDHLDRSCGAKQIRF